MSQVSFPYTTYELSSGDPVANGYLLINLSVDCMSPGGLVSSLQAARIELDSSGVIEGSPVFWPNASLSPSGSYYTVRVFSAIGQLAAGPFLVTI